MGTLLDWLKRIVAIGILEFLRRLGWRVLAGILLAIVALVGLVIALTIALIYLLL